MNSLIRFEFGSVDRMRGSDDAFVGSVRDGIETVDGLLRCIADALQFPAYFGGNWNALSDCLRDFHWVAQKKIKLVHGRLPVLPYDQLKIYLEVLRDATLDWIADDSHEFIVCFDVAVKEDVVALLL
ncbi:barstar family protein [Burkholderia sp. PAMC 28687]|uniref:barstar family protein n=1 Tax=Burkholderia sp. PAMC 28687 TaxID=1795874 RepID=UPI000ABCEBA5|nr:barstar family protein [Burkholderia sp. PAMC 28687]